MLKKLNNLPKVWLAMMAYMLFVIAVVLLFDVRGIFAWKLLNTIIYCIVAFIVLYQLRHRVRPDWFSLLNIIICYALLTFLYRQTAYTSSLVLPAIDEILIQADQTLFGFLPSLEFSNRMPHCAFNELFFFGYFSYYLMPVLILYLLFRHKKHKIEEFGFMLIVSFLAYYILFVFFPAVGPMFYYSYPSNHIDACGIFGRSVQFIQKEGEMPTGAFPSSHVGVSLIMVIWLFFHYRKLVKFFLPVVVILFFSTVYIKAHYAIDAIAGMVSAPIIYFLLIKCYRFISFHKN